MDAGQSAPSSTVQQQLEAAVWRDTERRGATAATLFNPSQQGLRVVADVLAAAFAQGEASRACTHALCRLCPGLQFASLAVINPAGSPPGCAPGLVAAANLAAQGPTTLHLLDAGRCAASLALQKRRPLAAGLRGRRPAAAALQALPDVQLMLEAAPACQRLLCIPFGHLEAGGGTQPACSADSGCAGCAGALLLGLEGAALQPGRLALLQHLAERLPAALAHMTADTLAFVNFACGTVGGGAACACCCEPGEDAEEGVQGQGGDSCRSGGWGNDDGGAGPSTALPVPIPAPAAPDEGRECSGRGTGGRTSPSCHIENAKQPRAAALPPSPRFGGCSLAPPQGSQLPCSKALAAAAAEEPGVLEMGSLTLRFRSQLAEQEFGSWRTPYYVATDNLAALLMLVAMVAVSFMQPFRAMYGSSAALSLGAGMPLPLALTFVGRLLGWRSTQTWRERIVVGFRLYALAFACLASIPARQLPLVQVARGLLGRCAAFLRLSGAEALLASAIGFLLPQYAHLPLQLAGLCAAIACLPHLCATVYSSACPTACVLQGAAAVAAVGFALPTMVLRCIEQRARRAFAAQVRAAAGSL